MVRSTKSTTAAAAPVDTDKSKSRSKKSVEKTETPAPVVETPTELTNEVVGDTSVNSKLTEFSSKLQQLATIFSSLKIKNVIQIGANDGERFDNLNSFLKKYECKTILVEPIKEFFDKLRINYKSQSNIFFENSFSSFIKSFWLFLIKIYCK